MKLIDFHQAKKEIPGKENQSKFDSGLVSWALDGEIKAYFKSPQEGHAYRWTIIEENEVFEMGSASHEQVLPPASIFICNRETLSELKRIRTSQVPVRSDRALYEKEGKLLDVRFQK